MVQRGRVIDRAMVNCQKMTSDRVFIVAQSRREARLAKDASTNTSNFLMTVKSPEAQILIPMAFSLLEENLCSYNIHNHMSVMAEESLTKQYCTIIQYTVM